MPALTLTTGAKFEKNTLKQQTVGTVAAALTPIALGDEVKKPEQIFVQALSTNGGIITIGMVGVTNGGPGIELIAGANMVLPSHTAEWYVIASIAGQKLNVMYSSEAY